MTPKGLRSIRMALGLSVSELAGRLGIPSDELRDYELGLRPIELTLSNSFERLSPRERPDRSDTPLGITSDRN